MEKRGYTLTDATAQLNNNSAIKKVYIASEKNGNYQIEFYSFADSDYANAFYTNNKTLFENSNVKNGVASTKTKGKTEKYTLKVNKTYKVISKVGNSVIYVNAADTYKNDINKALKSIHY